MSEQKMPDSVQRDLAGFGRIALVGLVIPVVMVVFMGPEAWALKVAWNWAVVPLWNLPPLTFWSAFFLILLVRVIHPDPMFKDSVMQDGKRRILAMLLRSAILLFFAWWVRP